jgi:hypothetical protein
MALRQIASDLRSPASRALVLSLATDYELLASNAEAAEALAGLDAAMEPDPQPTGGWPRRSASRDESGTH